MENREIREIIEKAQEGDKAAVEKIIEMFKPLMIRNSYINGVFNEDCYQELCIRLINCIHSFHFKPDQSIKKSFERTLKTNKGVRNVQNNNQK
ncbi:helix-turn-helix domain-containing protein [Alkaliphilus crotonatoxidans]